ncbi:MAG: hypothetical protein AB7G11_02045 [Phycisphaerales bacterium]
MRSYSATPQVFLPPPPADPRETDHLAGVESALTAAGVSVARLEPRVQTPRLTDATRVVIVPNAESSVCRYLIREARRIDAASILLMDGIVEWRNTFLNPRSGPGFLRPAPVDLIACAGDTDANLLQAMGNDARPTGLPRLARFAHLWSESRGAAVSIATPRTLLIATARCAVFNHAEHARLIEALRSLHAAARDAGIRTHWRVGPLAAELGVANDSRALIDLLQDCDAVATTPSTLLVESMLASKRVGVIHPHPTPLWQPAAALFCGPHDESRRQSIARLDWPGVTGLSAQACRTLQQLASDADAGSRRFEDAGSFLQHLLASGRPPAEPPSGVAALHAPVESTLDRLCELVKVQIKHPSRSQHAASFADGPVSISPPPLAGASVTRVVFMVSCDDGAAGTTLRSAQAMARGLMLGHHRYDARVLAFAAAVDSWRAAGQAPPCDDVTTTCVLDPYEDNAGMLARVSAALAAFRPTVIVAADRDVCFAAALSLRHATLASHQQLRVIALASDEHDLFLADHYSRWDGGISLSARAQRGLRPLALRLGVPTIHVDAPSLASPALTRDSASLLHAFIGNVRSAIRAWPPSAVSLSLIEDEHRFRPAPVEVVTLRERVERDLKLAGFAQSLWSSGSASGAPADGAIIVPDAADLRELLALRQRLRASPLPCAREPDRTVWFPSLLSGTSRLGDEITAREQAQRIRDRLQDSPVRTAQRLAIFGLGKHFVRHSWIVSAGLPIVGIIDDHAAATSCFGLPVVRLDQAASELRPDVVLLFSDAHERQMWDRTIDLRRAGVKVVAIYQSADGSPGAAVGVGSDQSRAA